MARLAVSMTVFSAVSLAAINGSAEPLLLRLDPALLVQAAVIEALSEPDSALPNVPTYRLQTAGHAAEVAIPPSLGVLRLAGSAGTEARWVAPTAYEAARTPGWAPRSPTIELGGRFSLGVAGGTTPTFFGTSAARTREQVAGSVERDFVGTSSPSDPLCTRDCRSTWALITVGVRF